nr:gustatory receptor 31 [Papilio glaucus]
MLDKEFVSVFAPMHLISTCLFIRKYNLYKNRVTRSSTGGILFALIGMIAVYFMLYLTLNSLSNIVKPLTYYMYFFIYVQYAVSCNIIIFINLYHSISHSKLLTTLQRIFGYLPDRCIIKRIKIIVWISCFTMLLSHGIFMTFKFILDPYWTIEKCCFILLTFILDFELFYPTVVIQLMACKMKQWTQVINKKDENTAHGYRIPRRTLTMMFNTYKSLLDALALVKRSTQWTILLHFVISFTLSLSFLGILMCTADEVINSTLMTNRVAGIVILIMKSLTMETIYCIVCENLYREVNSAQVAAILLGSHQQYTTAKAFVKNIRRLNSLQFQKLNSCGVFVVDAKLPLQLGALILNHTVVLLQFAISKQ